MCTRSKQSVTGLYTSRIFYATHSFFCTGLIFFTPFKNDNQQSFENHDQKFSHKLLTKF
ncbi:MAG: hypothetical protein Dbin4_02841 [Alphaproteobacteria bacterium]|nr:hypothetical protein [Alphaproteobacteria bacterium]